MCLQTMLTQTAGGMPWIGRSCAIRLPQSKPSAISRTSYADADGCDGDAVLPHPHPQTPLPVVLLTAVVLMLVPVGAVHMAAVVWGVVEVVVAYWVW